MSEINSAISLAPSIIEAARLTIQGIDSKVQAAKANKDKDKTINNLESIINELINNQNTLIRNQQVLENELNSQMISDSDLNYISNTLLPIVSDMLLSNIKNHEEKSKIEEQIKTIEAVISTELLKVLQIIGFNIKDAIGNPGTRLVRTLIENSIQNPEKQINYNTLALETQMKLAELSQNEEDYNRFIYLISNIK